MAFIKLALLHSAAASLLQDFQAGPSPYVLDYIDKMNGDCTAAHCIDQLDRCSDGSDPECQNRLNCIREAGGVGDAGQCLKQMKWSQLDDTEVKVLDCAHSNKCMPDEFNMESSFLELLSKEKEKRGLAEEGKASSAMTSEEQEALHVVAAHLAYLQKTEEMVKRTQGMMEEVLQDKSMSLEDKIEALHMLTGHLSLLQDSAKKTMQGMGMDTQEFEEEERDEADEDDLEEKMQKGDGTKPKEKDTKTPEAKAAQAEEKPKAAAPEKAEKGAASKPSTKEDATSAKAKDKKPEAAAKPAKESESKKPETKKPEALVETEGKGETKMNMRTMDE